MGLENNFSKKDTQSEGLQKLKDEQKAALREMRDSITGTAYIDAKMKGLLNTWSQWEAKEKDTQQLQTSFKKSMEMLFEIARDELGKTMDTPEGKAEQQQVLKQRAEDFSKIAKRHSFEVDPRVL